MNIFVKEKIGITATHFTNPHGLPDSDHYTTAKDMALIARFAMNNSMFRQIVSTKTKQWVGKEWQSELVNHNKMLWRYDGANGIKNGYTGEVGFTLVSSAERNDVELIGVTLKATSDEILYADMTSLLDYGFANFDNLLEENQVEVLPSPFASDVQNRIDHEHQQSEEKTIHDRVPTSQAAATESKSDVNRRSPWAVAVTCAWLLILIFMNGLAAIRFIKMRAQSGRNY